jgi:hypothetical protein
VLRRRFLSVLPAASAPVWLRPWMPAADMNCYLAEGRPGATMADLIESVRPWTKPPASPAVVRLDAAIAASGPVFVRGEGNGVPGRFVVLRIQGQDRTRWAFFPDDPAAGGPGSDPSEWAWLAPRDARTVPVPDGV